MAAPKGNKYAVGAGGGRPPIYETPESLMEEVENYFEYVKGESHIETKIVIEDGTPKECKIVVWDRHPEPTTITGLALYLGFESRQSLYDYGKRDDFSYVIKRCKMRIEHAYEKELARDKPTGAIFALKNMGWADRQEIDHTSAGEKIQSNQEAAKVALMEIAMQINSKAKE